jgi:DNA-binding HxlR family transcriptional regulator
MKTKAEKGSALRRSPCPVANTLDLVGDKWTLLIVRDMRHGRRTYGELADSPEGIPTNILADRLKRLEDAGIIARTAYQERPVRYAYTLTAKGEDLGELLGALVRWGKKHIPGTRTRSEAEGAVRKIK